jgi:hypothetical protein
MVSSPLVPLRHNPLLMFMTLVSLLRVYRVHVAQRSVIANGSVEDSSSGSRG